MKSSNVYIVIANEEERVRECVVLSNFDEAKQVFEVLKPIWGGANVALVSRMVDDIPQNILDALNQTPQTRTISND